jgi:hypothetical protein
MYTIRLVHEGDRKEILRSDSGKTGRKRSRKVNRLKWAIGLAKLGSEKDQTTWQTEIYGGN